MLMLVSPAKTLDYETPLPFDEFTQPELLDQSQLLMDELVDLTPKDVATLMKLSDKLSMLNVNRFQHWATPFTPDNARPAMYAFKGDVYTGLDAYSLKKADVNFAQKHLRMLSGLYGLLKPLDLMQPYRLEMGTKFSNQRGANLYEFWGDRITQKINEEAAAKDVVLNLASNEYFKAVKTKQLKGRVITPVFKDEKNGQYKIISFYAKKARGLMAAFVIKNRIKDVQDIRKFDVSGYKFSPEQSNEKEWVFMRSEQNA
ncbi:MAG: peroxide stress protein YaaA [Bermanella sp.]|nr:peroxide stress protein YaaA [Bermanella sp.]|tara:strand:+ start:449 stop:1222 length:774 start_codon:yes stop_codon:yes gene_type:complete